MKTEHISQLVHELRCRCERDVVGRARCKMQEMYKVQKDWFVGREFIDIIAVTMIVCYPFQPIPSSPITIDRTQFIVRASGRA